jgi:RNA polymerase sigma-70 factor, ECF subfamily
VREETEPVGTEKALISQLDEGRGAASATRPVAARPVAARLETAGREAARPETASEARFEAVFRAHYRRLVRSLALACGNQDLAADLVQQAFAQLWADWGRISGYESPSTWVARVAISRLRDHRRSLRRGAAALLRLGQPPEATETAAFEGLDIRTALSRLPLKQRLAVVLFYLDDRPVAQVADMMGVSEGTVNRHLFRAREALRRELKED